MHTIIFQCSNFFTPVVWSINLSWISSCHFFPPSITSCFWKLPKVHFSIALEVDTEQMPLYIIFGPLSNYYRFHMIYLIFIFRSVRVDSQVTEGYWRQPRSLSNEIRDRERIPSLRMERVAVRRRCGRRPGSFQLLVSRFRRGGNDGWIRWQHRLWIHLHHRRSIDGLESLCARISTHGLEFRSLLREGQPTHHSPDGTHCKRFEQRIRMGPNHME